MLQPIPWIGRILWQGKTFGTGFLVHHKGWVATCYHVLEDATKSNPVGQEFTFELLNGAFSAIALATASLDKGNDLALLRLTEPLPPEIAVASLVSGAQVTAGTEVQVQGYGVMNDPSHKYNFLSALGKFVGVFERDDVLRIQLESTQILQGMSGGPVFLPGHAQQVMAVLSERFLVRPNDQFMEHSAWAIPIEKLVALKPDLLSLVELKQEKAEQVAPAPSISIEASHGGIAAYKIGKVEQTNHYTGEPNKRPTD